VTILSCGKYQCERECAGRFAEFCERASGDTRVKYEKKRNKKEEGWGGSEKRWRESGREKRGIKGKRESERKRERERGRVRARLGMGEREGESKRGRASQRVQERQREGEKDRSSAREK